MGSPHIIAHWLLNMYKTNLKICFTKKIVYNTQETSEDNVSF